jgi:hypothetical protein
VQTCSVVGGCANYVNIGGLNVPYSDTIQSVYPALASNYVEAPVNFGDWLHSGIAPRGIFFDEDSDPYTDNDLVAYWNGTAWVKNYDSNFAAATEAELNTWGNNAKYSVGAIEDSLNLGINYIVNVGDDLDGDTILNETSKITIRIIPVVSDDSAASGTWMTNAPASGDLLPVSGTTTSGGGGGCAIGGDGRIDPTLPALLAAGLGFFGWRRFKAGK